MYYRPERGDSCCRPQSASCRCCCYAGRRRGSSLIVKYAICVVARPRLRVTAHFGLARHRKCDTSTAIGVSRCEGTKVAVSAAVGVAAAAACVYVGKVIVYN